jgi:hypothetical protein
VSLRHYTAIEKVLAEVEKSDTIAAMDAAEKIRVIMDGEWAKLTPAEKAELNAREQTP